jgi:hypothetical protein
VYLHEEIERESEGLELGNEVSDGAERAKIERHDDDLGVGKLGHDTCLGVLRSLDAPSREDQPRPSHGQDPSRLRPDPRRSAW